MYSLTQETPSSMEETKTTKEIIKEESLFSSVPKAKKGLSSKEKKLMTMAKFAKVSVEELKKELKEEEHPHSVVSTNESVSDKGVLSFLPSPKNDSTDKYSKDVLNKPSAKAEVALRQDISASNKKADSFATDVQDEDELQEENGSSLGMNGIIPLNPFLSDVKSIESSKSKVDEEVNTPLMFKTVYRTKSKSKSKSSKRGTLNVPSDKLSTHARVDQLLSSSSNPSSDAVPSNSSTSSSTINSNSNAGYGYGYGYGYGGNFSQSQYEAFIRRSGMLATAGAASSSSTDLLVGFA